MVQGPSLAEHPLERVSTLTELCIEYTACNFEALNLDLDELNALPEDCVARILFYILRHELLTHSSAVLFSKCNHGMVQQLLKLYNIQVTNFTPLDMHSMINCSLDTSIECKPTY